MFKSKRAGFLPLFVAAFVILGSLSTGASGKEASGPSDDFNDNIIDLARWFVPDFDPQYSSVAEVNQQLEMSLTDANLGDFFGVNVWSTWQLDGDFDIQVDYRLLLWPPENEIRVGLIAGGNNVERSGRAEPLLDFYLTNFDDGVQGQVETDVDEGSLRLVREGSQISGYYSDETTGGEWVLIHTYHPCSTNRFTVELAIWGHESTPDVLVAFDNFVVNAGEIYTPIDQLIDLIKSVGLNQGIERSLVAKLENGQKAFMKGQRNAGLNTLNAFINEVEAQSGKGIPEPLADILISTAEAIISRVSSVPSAAPARQREVDPVGKLTTSWGRMKDERF
jgi:hypothetical protein